MSTNSDNLLHDALPGPLRESVKCKVSSGAYGSTDEFIVQAVREKLARDEAKECEDAQLAQKLLEGLDSGDGVVFTDEYFETRKQKLAEQFRSQPHP